jgi:hypothetical protein
MERYSVEKGELYAVSVIYVINKRQNFKITSIRIWLNKIRIGRLLKEKGKKKIRLIDLT